MVERGKNKSRTENKPGRFFPVEPGPLADALQAFFRQIGINRRLETFQVLGQFTAVFPELSPFCRATDYRDQVLFLAVSDPLYILEVQKKIPVIVKTYSERGLPVRRVKLRCDG